MCSFVPCGFTWGEKIEFPIDCIQINFPGIPSGPPILLFELPPRSDEGDDTPPEPGQVNPVQEHGTAELFDGKDNFDLGGLGGRLGRRRMEETAATPSDADADADADADDGSIVPVSDPPELKISFPNFLDTESEVSHFVVAVGSSDEDSSYYSQTIEGANEDVVTVLLDNPPFNGYPLHICITCVNTVLRETTKCAASPLIWDNSPPTATFGLWDTGKQQYVTGEGVFTNMSGEIRFQLSVDDTLAGTVAGHGAPLIQWLVTEWADRKMEPDGQFILLGEEYDECLSMLSVQTAPSVDPFSVTHLFDEPLKHGATYCINVWACDSINNCAMRYSKRIVVDLTPPEKPAFLDYDVFAEAPTPCSLPFPAISDPPLRPFDRWPLHSGRAPM